jgi:hypothetical protein
MDKPIIFLAVLALALCGLATLALRPTVDKVATAVIEEQTRTDPMESLITYSAETERKTSPIIYIFCGMLPLVVLFTAVFFMEHATDFLRERRLSRRKGRRHSPTLPLPHRPDVSHLYEPSRVPLPAPPHDSQGDRQW